VSLPKAKDRPVVITALAAQADWLLTLDEAAGTVTSDADILRDALSGGGVGCSPLDL
jgi:hypothetical protein